TASARRSRATSTPGCASIPRCSALPPACPGMAAPARSTCCCDAPCSTAATNETAERPGAPALASEAVTPYPAPLQQPPSTGAPMSLEQHYVAILDQLGEDVTREGLRDTPKRAAKAMRFLCRGYEQT